MAAIRRQTKLITGSPAPEPEKRNYMREYFRMGEDVLRRLDVEHKFFTFTDMICLVINYSYH